MDRPNKSKISGNHQKIAMGKIDEAQNTIDHGIADGDEGIEAAQRNPVNYLLQENQRGHGFSGSARFGHGGFFNSASAGRR